ncbi:conserved hypothetical protein [uncultured Pleomorphomonas sp.]|uniref:Uncharacterized protein n=1 Tax=uncultured Pleomorphomonas sp. TaxID=442121 RepID=A0A212LQN4_9HYPH|nr:hypothetical protein [uncultured Pleomorphomonas sp.]SCM79888.1 conserved hypothetical protein [uncultured Pleomorphomonas sp.]
MSVAIVWIAGPIGYAKTLVEGGQSFRWSFIAGDGLGCIRRYTLAFETKTREFRVIAPDRNGWEQAHADLLTNLYRPISILRSDLPKGKILDALRGMLTDRDLSIVSAASLLRAAS